MGGLKENMEDEDLQQYFSQFGNVASVTRSVSAVLVLNVNERDCK